MAKSGDFFEEYEPHTRHKLLILRHYFESWGFKLGLRENAGSDLLYVDACAGRGSDKVGTPGSPLIAARAAAVASSRIAEMRKEPFRIRVVAIEAKKANFDSLQVTLRSFGESVEVKQGTLSSHLPELERRFGETPTLFFIDPFGLKPLEAEVVRRALSGPHHEAFLLFAGQAALRHFGAVVAQETRTETRLRREVERHESREPSLFPDFNAEAEVAHEKRRGELERAAKSSRESLVLTRAAAIRILNTAYGDVDWLSDVDSVSPEFRRSRLLTAYRDRLHAWGALYSLPIPILSESGQYVYSLVHATKSPVGYSAMKKAVEFAMKHSDLPTDTLTAMRHAMRTDIEDVVAKAVRHFAGALVRWAEDKANPRLPCVQRFVLEQTEAWPADRDEILARLKRYRRPGQTIVFEFPPNPNGRTR